VTELDGVRVRLRAFRPEEIELASRRMAGGDSLAPSGLDDEERVRRFRSRLERSGARNEWEVLFAIEADERLVGDAQGRCSDTAMPPGVWEIGLELWEDADRGHGLGRETVRLLTTYLFAEQEAIRVQASTDVDNRAMRGVLDRLGFGREGVLRGFMLAADGPPRDYVLYGITRNDWERAKDRWTRTS
jgi:RimJ/RimL family protein N-acetyltransferase